MIDGSDRSIVNLRLILYCFEWLSCLKINFHKSGLYIFGVDQHEKVRMTNMLNCALSSLPLKYLAIPISDGHLQSSVVPILRKKMKKRLDPWKGKHLSSGGRLVLTNSCLNSLPLYTMGFYIFPKNMHPKMDVVRANFFWQGA